MQARFVFTLIACLSFVHQTTAAPPTRDVVFASPDGHDLKLDLFLPDGVENPPLVVFIHGGGWKNGSYKRCLTPWLPDEGFALASISYRLSDVATFPAQIHDCKAAIRWLRARADEYGYDAKNIGVTGTSAGGYNVLMLGVTSGVEELEGTVGEHLDQSSAVQAVVDYYGPSDFVSRAKFQPHKTDQPEGGVYGLLGGPVLENLDLAKFASPITHITADDPPLMILHGEKDKTVLVRQGQIMADAYQSAGLEVTLKILPNAGHGGKSFFSGENRTAVVKFLKDRL